MVLNDDLGSGIPQDPVARFEDFFRMVEEPVGTFLYINKIKYMIAEGSRSLYVDHEHLSRHDIQLARDLHDNPTEFLKKANQALVNIMHEQSGGTIKLTDEYFVRFFNLDRHYKVKLRKIRSQHMERLFSISGSLIRATNVRPQITMAEFECKICGATQIVQQVDDELSYPSICNVGGCKNAKKSDFRLMGRTSEFIDWQQIRVQEMPEELSSGNVPRFLDALLLHDMVDTCRPGDRVTMVGVIKILPVKKMASGVQQRVFQMIMHVNNIYSEEEENESLEISEEDEEKIKALAADPMIHEKITRSIAPDIYGMDEIKKAAAMVLFGGVHKTRKTGHKMRGDIHILVMGDPGTGKSQIIKSVSRLAPRAIYTSGQGSTAAGLTAAVLKDETSGGMVLEAGALVLADGGIAAIDEFDKMKPADRVAIHEAMEQQSYHHDTELLLTNGQRVAIGKIVDRLMEENKEKVIQGVNCEILPFNELEVYSTDFSTIFKIRVDRVSRHPAPETFLKFTFANGRSILVTPEHPMFVFRDGQMLTIPAEAIVQNDFVPAPAYLPNSARAVPLTSLTREPHSLAKEIKLPDTLSIDLARMLGFFITEGYSSKGSSIEIGFSNLNQGLLAEFRRLMLDLFKISPTVSTRADGLVTLRYLSVVLHEWFTGNFPEVMVLSRHKHVPAKIMGASMQIVKNFLATAFKGDGSVETTAVCFRTASEKMSHDYQDLLLKVGIQSRIVHDNHNDSYKVYIRAQSMQRFVEEIVEQDERRMEKIIALLNPRTAKVRHHDVFPTTIVHDLISLKKSLGVKYNGYFDRHVKQGHGITRNVLIRECRVLEEKIGQLQGVNKSFSNVRSLRAQSNLSQASLARIAGLSRRTIDYLERGGYDGSKRNERLNAIRRSLATHLDACRQKLNSIKKIIDADVLWERIKEIKIIDNIGEGFTPYVYDVTVEPNHTFISQAMILHNTVSIAKAGIVATLNARTSIIAAANPKFGRYDENVPAAENINLQPSILSRFDLIFIVKDEPVADNDTRVADHILKLHMPEDTLGADAEVIEAPIDLQLLKKYIKYAETECSPSLTPDAAERIKNFYLKMRKPAQGDEDAPIPIVARTLEGLVRLSEAHAKMALRKEITMEDVNEVIKLQEYSMRQVGWDAERQVFDVDSIQLGKSKSKSQKMKKVYQIIKNLQEERQNEPVDEEEILERALFESIKDDEARKLIEDLKKDSQIIEKRNGKFLVLK